MEKNLKNIECFLFDLDGTLYVGGVVIEGAKATLEEISKLNKKICFLTNNSSLSTEDYAAKLKSKGLLIEGAKIMSSGGSAIQLLKSKYYGKSVYPVCTESYKKELIDKGINIVEDNPDIVLLTYDTSITYEKLSKACIFIKDGATYIATHHDINCPSDKGYLPDAGSYMALIKTSTGRDCDIICGKPFTPMADYVKSNFPDINNQNIAMVGDRIYTDIMFGKENGFVSILTMTGETDVVTLKNSSVKPDFVIASVNDIKNLI